MSDGPLLRRQTLTSQVIDYVVGLIKSRQAKPGDRLPTEKELTKTLGVSRTCVREAMKSLESLGVVRIRQRVGATVLEPSPARLLNAEHFSLAIQEQHNDALLEFRKILEVGLAWLAAEKAEEADLAAMKEALDNYQREAEEKHVNCWTDMSFHAALAAAAKNPIALAVWQMISTHLAEALARAMKVPHVVEETLRDHVKIYQAVRERNPRRAREAMRAHLGNAERVWGIARTDAAVGPPPVLEPSSQPAAPDHQGKAKSTSAVVPVAIPK